MKKWKLFLRLFVFALSWMVFASAAQQTEKACVFDGFYTNLSLGGALRSGKGTWTNNSITNFELLLLNEAFFRNRLTFNLRQPSPLVALSIGQGYTSYGNFYGGWEGFVSYSKYKRHSPIVGHSNLLTEFNAAVTNTVRTSLNSIEVGFDLKPGFVLNCSALLYGRLGVAYNKLTLQSTPGFTMTIPPPAGPYSASAMTTVENSKKRTALRLGLGLEQHLGNCLSLRVDYAFTYYGKISAVVMDTHSIVEAGSTTAATITDTTRIKLIGNTVTLGLSYWW